ncbi:hypothetical protein D3C75_1018190 [compost metagenome]
MRLPTTGGDHQHRALAGHRALAIAVAPMPVGMFAHAIGKTIGIHAIHPTLQDGRHREPPQRELQDDRIGPAQLFLFGGDVGALPAGPEGVARIQ